KKKERRRRRRKVVDRTGNRTDCWNVNSPQAPTWDGCRICCVGGRGPTHPLSCMVVQAGIYPRPDTETLPELPEQHRIRQKEEELGGLESVLMEEFKTKCTSPGLNNLLPESVTANSGVCDLRYPGSPLIISEGNRGSSHGGVFRKESLDIRVQAHTAQLHPDQIKTETNDRGYMQVEHRNWQNMMCIDIKSKEVKRESSEGSAGDPLSTELNEAGVDDGLIESLQSAGEPHLSSYKSGKKRSGLIQDERNCKGKKPYQCTQCAICFLQLCDLQKHYRMHASEKPYKCDQCGQCFAQKLFLINHQTIHAVEKPFKCDRCEMSFVLNSHLYAHHKIHKGEKRYFCHLCGRGFTRKYCLNLHDRIHTGEKPYKCDLCGKGFLTKSHFSDHQRIHTGEKPFRCDQCGRCFTCKSHLNDHLRSHNGEKPHRCAQCGKCYSQRFLLKRHLGKHLDEEP
ncbi:hypothetical protein GJAV_G00087170, partial [Gymnothorax javanicus]